jgi:hypothetical protein
LENNTVDGCIAIISNNNVLQNIYNMYTCIAFTLLIYVNMYTPVVSDTITNKTKGIMLLLCTSGLVGLSYCLTKTTASLRLNVRDGYRRPGVLNHISGVYDRIPN